MKINLEENYLKGVIDCKIADYNEHCATIPAEINLTYSLEFGITNIEASRTISPKHPARHSNSVKVRFNWLDEPKDVLVDEDTNSHKTRGKKAEDWFIVTENERIIKLQMYVEEILDRITTPNIQREYKIAKRPEHFIHPEVKWNVSEEGILYILDDVLEGGLGYNEGAVYGKKEVATKILELLSLTSSKKEEGEELERMAREHFPEDTGYKNHAPSIDEAEAVGFAEFMCDRTDKGWELYNKIHGYENPKNCRTTSEFYSLYLKTKGC